MSGQLRTVGQHLHSEKEGSRGYTGGGLLGQGAWVCAGLSRKALLEEVTAEPTLKSE